jgi:hypothetical protein
MYNEKVTNERATMACEASREPELRIEMGRLEKETHVLVERVDALTNRLTPILRTEPSSGGKDVAVPMTRTPLGGAIRDFRDRIGNANENLTRLLDLLEM